MNRPVLVSVFAATVALWLLQRPYVGIAHDGVLYLAQALSRLHPGQLSADLFFSFGSQDQFTLMPAGYGWLIGLSGAPGASIVLTLLGQVAFITAAAWCLRAWLPWPLLPYALVALGAARFYGGWLTLSYSEPFVTARLLGEPLVLVAIGLLARARPLAALVPLGLAVVVHPLVALSGAAIYGLALLLHWPWLAVPAVLAILGLVAGVWLEWPPLTPLMARFDEAWWLVVIDRNEMVFPGLWESKVWAVALACAWLLAYALATQFRASTDANRTLLAVWTAGVAGVLAAFVGADIFRLVLVTQLQLWRWLWPLQLLAMAVLPLVFVALWQERQRQPQRLLGLALVVTALAANPWPGAIAAVPVGAALMLWRARDGSFTARGSRALLGLAVFTVLFGLASAAAFAFDAEFLAANRHWRPFNALLWISPVVAPLLLWLVHRALVSARWTWLGYAAVAGIVVTAALTWDSRSDFQQDQEAALNMTAGPFGTLPADAVVFWQPNPLLAWMVLDRPSFFTNYQAAGALFNRGTALEWDRRRGQIATKKLTQTRCFEGMVEDDDSACRWNRAQLMRACAIVGGPTHVVSPTRIAAYPSRDWELRHAAHHPKSLHLYDCAEVRALKELP